MVSSYVRIYMYSHILDTVVEPTLYAVEGCMES